MGMGNGQLNPLDPCLHCNSNVDPHGWTLCPEGTLCGGWGSDAICTEEGECLVPEEDE